jgi:hypothetical protein
MPLHKRIGLTLSTLVAIAGCGSSDVPAKQLAESEAAIRAASEVGAQENPQAALHLKLARDRYDQAQTASKEGEQENARLLLEKAEADAELALALTRKEQAAAKAEQAKRKLAPNP